MHFPSWALLQKKLELSKRKILNANEFGVCSNAANLTLRRFAGLQQHGRGCTTVYQAQPIGCTLEMHPSVKYAYKYIYMQSWETMSIDQLQAYPQLSRGKTSDELVLPAMLKASVLHWDWCQALGLNRHFYICTCFSDAACSKHGYSLSAHKPTKEQCTNKSQHSQHNQTT